MAADPLDSIRRQIEEAASLPVAQPYTRSADPLDKLRTHLRGEAANSDKPAAPAASGPASGLESVLGREVLEMVSSTPLPAAAREEAVRRLAVALANPTTDNVRAVLRVLLTGRADG